MDKRLIALRNACGYSQLELARIADIKQSVISDIENGKTLNPRSDTCAKLAAALGVTMDELVNGNAGSNKTKPA